MRLFARRVIAYLRGHHEDAAGVGNALVHREREVAWIADARDSELVRYALEAAQRSATIAEDAVKTLTDKASALLTLDLAIFAVLAAGTGLAIQIRHDPPWLGWVSISLFAAAYLCVIASALNAFLGTSTATTVGINLFRSVPIRGKTVAAYQRAEALLWHERALVAMETTTRRGNDVFASRRWLLGGVALASLALTATTTGIVSPVATRSGATPTCNHAAVSPGHNNHRGDCP